jgi:hypothetical protein
LDDDVGAFDETAETDGKHNKLELLTEKLEEIKKRCNKASIEFEDRKSEKSTYAAIKFKSGREKRSLLVGSVSLANRLLNIDFENYIFIRRYEAICNYSTGTIEALFRMSAYSGVSEYGFAMLSKLRPESVGMDTDETSDIVIAPPAGDKRSPTLRLGRASNEFLALTRGPSPRLTLLISGIQAKNHDDATRELRNYADSLFFQIDLLTDITLSLDHERRRRVVKRSDAVTEASVSLQYPRQSYSEAAISLYWYAKRARGMPLLQFLAFYQSVEFFFPRFAHAETRKKLSVILKNPTFRPDRDDDVDRIIAAIRVGRGVSLGDERSQLRAVINQCISAEDMRSFFQDDPDQVDHHSGKSGKSRYSKIPLLNKAADLRNDAADRIYDIRCKIVHTKNDAGDGEPDMILPFSEDADYLMLDIDLVQFIAKSVLIASSSPL